jgi:phage-related minor tail protein
MGSALGNVFNRGRIVPFAYGGIINYPTMFPMSGGQTGLMGENGPEAVMPLRRTSRGRLGVETAGGSNIPVVNVSVQVNNEAGKPIKPEDINISIDFVEAVGQAWVQNYNQNGIVRRTVKGQM